MLGALDLSRIQMDSDHVPLYVPSRVTASHRSNSSPAPSTAQQDEDDTLMRVLSGVSELGREVQSLREKYYVLVKDAQVGRICLFVH